MTTDSDTLLVLADAVERAEGADRELDFDILRATSATFDADWHDWKKYRGRPVWIAMRDNHPASSVPAYTASLDAAMTLLDDYRQSEPDQYGYAPSILRRHDGSACADVHISPIGDMAAAQGATPALALTAAALRARATSLPVSGKERS